MNTGEEGNSIILKAIERAVQREGGAIPFADFVEIALYHPEAGYYRQDRVRIGLSRDTDFFTATSTGEIFGRLVIDACRALLAPEPLKSFCFVEVGPETGGGILPEDHPFGGSRTYRVGEPVEVPGPAVLFSNELFDAQPFHRLVFHDGAWREIGIAWKSGPAELLLPDLSPPVKAVAQRLPPQAPEGYHLDVCPAAEKLLLNLVEPEWRGLFLAFDYGKSWRELVEETPHGTARAYARHRQSNDLLARPGQQDLTCHVCWDHLQTILAQRHFAHIALESQEAFFVTRATRFIEEVITARPGERDPRRQSLQQLIYPGHMGQKFQVLSARR